ncbi:MAG TPA: DoxX family protein [Nitrososphaeraceae archaeon]|nr:DoxX family protein [Nitrososphaeraceae archaeon]
MFGPLPIRFLAGIAFIVAGLPKFEKNIAVTQGFFQQFGLPLELALPIGLLEVIDGIFLLVGVVTRITAAAIFVIEMIGGTLVVGLSQGFVGGYELALLLMAICTSLLLTIPRRISIKWGTY